MSADRGEPRRRARARLHDTVRLSADGLAKVLGDLEARVLRAVWDLGVPTPARQIHDRVAQAHEVALLTVVTVLNKLVAKGLLSRSKRHGLLHYSARMSESELTEQVSRRIVEGILSLSPQAVSASFVDVLGEQDPAQLEELARLIRRRLARERRRGTPEEE